MSAAATLAAGPPPLAARTTTRAAAPLTRAAAPAPLAAAAAAAARQRPALRLLQQRQAARPAAPRRRCTTAAAATVDAEAARKMLDGQAVVVDVRSEREWDEGHITKPPRKSVSLPYAAGDDGGAFVAAAARKLPNRNAAVLVMCADGGAASAAAADLLAAAGYGGTAQLAGGYAAYSAIWGPSGKRRPPAGRWVSTGKEALKSGLNIPGVAESYDEGGNLKQARWAEGLPPGESLLDPLDPRR